MSYADFGDYLKQHGIDPEFAKKEFGWQDLGNRVAIPITDTGGQFLYNKYRHLSGNPKFSFDPESTATLYNSKILASPSKFPILIICEGEPDCVRLAQEGFLAVSSTTGASSFKEEWAEQIQKTKKQVIILLDNDPAGQEGAEKIKNMLPSAWVARLPDNTKDVCDYLLSHSTSDLVKLLKQVRASNTMDFKSLCQVIDKWLKLPDKNVLKVIMAGLVAHHFQSDPLWMFLVAPPSGTKTELITTLSSLPFVYPLSDLTAQTLVSGMISKKDSDPSLLLKLKNNVIAMKDFTTVLSMRQEERAIILSQLREIYDGSYSKAYGTGKKVEWEGRITMLAGVTTMIDTHLAVFQVMGERFLMYRIPQPNDKEAARLALHKTGQEKEMRKDLKQAMKRFFNSIVIPNMEEVVLPENILNSLASLASFIAIARSGIIRDGYSREITYIPAPEAPTRLVKQFGTLIKALAVVDGRKIVSWEDYMLTLKVALDVIPRNRTVQLLALTTAPFLTTKEAGDLSGYSISGAQMFLEDLFALRLVTASRPGMGISSSWSFSAKTEDYFKDILPEESHAFIPTIFTEDNEYYPLIKRMSPDKEDPIIKEAKEIFS